MQNMHEMRFSTPTHWQAMLAVAYGGLFSLHLAVAIVGSLMAGYAFRWLS